MSKRNEIISLTSKQKAKQLIDRFKTKTEIFYYEDSVPTIKSAEKTLKYAKQDALRCVAEILIYNYSVHDNNYWKEVTEEIINYS